MSVKPYPRWFYRLPAKYHEAVVPTNPYPRWLTWLALLAVLLLGLSSLYEWFIISVLADKQVIADYKSVYASPEAYATSALHTALICLPVAMVFAFAVKKDNTFYRLLALGFLILVLALCSFFS